MYICSIEKKKTSCCNSAFSGAGEVQKLLHKLLLHSPHWGCAPETADANSQLLKDYSMLA